MYNSIRPHIGQFTRYLASGASAAVVDFGSYYLLVQIGLWYIAASIAGNILGFATAFLCHKYLVFEKRSAFLKHLSRYAVVDTLSSGAATVVLFILVEYVGLSKEVSKIISMGAVALWNFFLYKFLVYV